MNQLLVVVIECKNRHIVPNYLPRESCSWEYLYDFFILMQNPSLNSYIMIEGKPCKVLNVSTTTTGGILFTAEDIFTGQKLEKTTPVSEKVDVPYVTRTEWKIMDISDDGKLSLMDGDGEMKEDLNLPYNMADEIRNAWAYGENLVYVTVLAAVGYEQVCEYVVGYVHVV